MIRLRPDWIGELVSLAARDDWAETTSDLDYPRISPMFRKLLPETAETDDAGGYSTVELRACRAGIDWLSKHYPEEYAALAWEFQPWKRKTLERQADHDERVIAAGALLAKFVDVMCSH
jgi:hypothetical protein